MARFFSALTISVWTSPGVRPWARTAPAYGTVMLPALSTFWFGKVMKLPGRTPASNGMKRPPAAASKMVTLTTSPMPNRISGACGRCGKTVASRGVLCARTSRMSGLSLTSA